MGWVLARVVGWGPEVERSPLEAPRGSGAAAGAAGPAAGRVGVGVEGTAGRDCLEQKVAEVSRAARGHLGSGLLVTRWFGILSGMRMGVSCMSRAKYRWGVRETSISAWPLDRGSS